MPRIDELNWRLMLRADIKFQNGKLLTATGSPLR
jgi:ABC-type transport system substrate-binding protein